VFPASGTAPLQRVQAQIRHKRCPLRATPIYSVLSLSSPPLRAERVTVFCFRLLRSLVPRSQKSKTKMVGKRSPTFQKSVVRNRQSAYEFFGCNLHAALLPMALHFSDFRIRKAKFHCADNALHLFWIASAHDSAGYSRMAQRPSNGHFTGRPAVPAAHNP
jgi:hypothetical protein